MLDRNDQVAPAPGVNFSSASWKLCRLPLWTAARFTEDWKITWKAGWIFRAGSVWNGTRSSATPAKDVNEALRLRQMALN
jgi:hypothetical protein